VLFTFTTMDRHMQNAYSAQGSFEIKQRLGGNSTLSVGYEHLRGLHLIVSVNQDVPVDLDVPARDRDWVKPDRRSNWCACQLQAETGRG